MSNITALKAKNTVVCKMITQMSQTKKHTSGKNDQVIAESVADYLDQTAQPGETVRERQIKRNAFIDGVQSGVFTFIPRECRRLPPVTAYSTLSITTGKTQSHRATLCPYFKTNLTEQLLNNSLDKYSPPPF